MTGYMSQPTCGRLVNQSITLNLVVVLDGSRCLGNYEPRSHQLSGLEDKEKGRREANGQPYQEAPLFEQAFRASHHEAIPDAAWAMAENTSTSAV